MNPDMSERDFNAAPGLLFKVAKAQTPRQQQEMKLEIVNIKPTGFIGNVMSILRLR